LQKVEIGGDEVVRDALVCERVGAERDARLFRSGRDLVDPRAQAIVVELDVDGERLVCCHATPTSNTDVVLPDAPHDRVASLVGDAAAVVAGHVHLQWLRRVGRTFWACVGSAGLAYEHKEPLDEQPFEPWAEYAIIGGSPLRIEFRRVAFAAADVVRAIGDSGIPDAQLSAAQWRTA
jgi:hypothetical protein